ncbi:unnamed protein product [Allacma fusca]|uniref:Cytochrome P450 n=1 Tax=Allacma fusca TaxID=39272 RepID=A0A8J2NZJ4_9HEXA|nr:unnamed protein product [Allacma fusca]
MNMDVFSGRPKFNLFKFRSKDGIARGIAVTDGHDWAEQRRFTFKKLRDFGFVVNVLWSIMFGEPLDQDDPELQEAFHSLVATMEEANTVSSLSIFIPWLATIAPKLSGFEKMFP